MTSPDDPKGPQGAPAGDDAGSDEAQAAAHAATTQRMDAEQLRRYMRAARGPTPAHDHPAQAQDAGISPISTQRMDTEQLRRFRRAAAGDPARVETSALSDGGPSLARVPSPPWHSLGHEESLLLARMDGRRDRAAVIDGCGIDEQQANGLIDGLIERGLAAEVEG